MAVPQQPQKGEQHKKEGQAVETVPQKENRYQEAGVDPGYSEAGFLVVDFIGDQIEKDQIASLEDEHDGRQEGSISMVAAGDGVDSLREVRKYWRVFVPIMKQGIVALTCQVGQGVEIRIVAVAGQGLRGIGHGHHQAEGNEEGQNQQKATVWFEAQFQLLAKVTKLLRF